MVCRSLKLPGHGEQGILTPYDHLRHGPCGPRLPRPQRLGCHLQVYLLSHVTAHVDSAFGWSDRVGVHAGRALILALACSPGRGGRGVQFPGIIKRTAILRSPNQPLPCRVNMSDAKKVLVNTQPQVCVHACLPVDGTLSCAWVAFSQCTVPMSSGGNKNALNCPIGPDGKRDWSYGLFDCFSDGCGACAWKIAERERPFLFVLMLTTPRRLPGRLVPLRRL